jgi:hypothetical protein
MDNLSKEISDSMNHDLLIDNISNMIGSKSSSCLQSQTYEPVPIEPENHLSSVSSTNSFELAVNNINNLFINNLTQLIIKKHDKGTTFDIIQRLVNQQMLQLNQDIDKLVKNFIKNQVGLDWKGIFDTKHLNDYLIRIFSKIERKEIFDHKYNVNDIFYMLYRVSPENSHKVIPKRQPNPFMLFRTVFALVSKNKNVIIKENETKMLAAVIWERADKSEKIIFRNLSLEFKQLHKTLFPDYEYRPRSYQHYQH